MLTTQKALKVGRKASVLDAHDPESVEGWSQGIGGPMLELKTSVFEHRSKSAPNVCQKASVSAARSNVHLSALNLRRKVQNAPIPAISAQSRVVIEI